MAQINHVLNPLTEQHCRTLDEVLLTYPSLKATFEALGRCGMDCGQFLSQLEMQYGVCQSIRREFNPLAPSLDILMSAAQKGPRIMTDAQCRTLDEAITSYPQLRATFEALQRCGHECEQFLAQLEAQYNICTTMKREFNPLSP